MSRGTVAEVVLPSDRIAYIQYLEPGPLCDLVRVLNGIFSEPQGSKRLDELVLAEEAFIAQCQWKSLGRRSSTARRGVWAIPDNAPLIIREAPTSNDVQQDIYQTPDGHYRKGVDVVERFPDIDLMKCPLSSCASDVLFLKRVDYGWTPAVSHIRGWLIDAEAKHQLKATSN